MALHTRALDRLSAAVTAPVTVVVASVPLGAVAASRLAAIPDGLSLVAWPALVAALLVDTALYNEAGVRAGEAGLWALALVRCHLEAAAIVGVARVVRRAGVEPPWGA